MDRHAIQSVNLHFEITNEQLSVCYTHAENLGSTSSKDSKATAHIQHTILPLVCQV